MEIPAKLSILCKGREVPGCWSISQNDERYFVLKFRNDLTAGKDCNEAQPTFSFYTKVFKLLPLHFTGRHGVEEFSTFLFNFFSFSSEKDHHWK